jgi:hypothetical protein
MKIVISKWFGDFGLSHQAVMEYAKRKGIKLWSVDYGTYRTYYREDPAKYPSKPPAIYPFDKLQQKVPDVPRDVYFYPWDIERDDPDLVAIVEADPKAAGSTRANLRVIEIPDGVEWEIDGEDSDREWVTEKHRIWGAE